MGNNSSLMLQDEELAEIQEETAFNKSQIARLYSRFVNLDKRARGYLEREDFLRIPELAINPLGDRIVDAFFAETAATKRCDDCGSSTCTNTDHLRRSFKTTDENVINFRQFIRVLARFRPISKNKSNDLNSRESKLKFAFNMYDLNGNGTITREEFEVILNMMVGANITQEQLKSIAERTITEADHDGDGLINFAEFCRAMDKTDIEQKMSIRFLH